MSIRIVYEFYNYLQYRKGVSDAELIDFNDNKIINSQEIEERFLEYIDKDDKIEIYFKNM